MNELSADDVATITNYAKDKESAVLLTAMVVAAPRCSCPCHTGMASHVAACQCQRPPTNAFGSEVSS